MANHHNITLLTGKMLGKHLNRLADLSIDEEEVKTQKFYIQSRGGKVEIFRLRFNPDERRAYVKFPDGERPTLKKLKTCLRDLIGQYKTFLRREIGSYKKAVFSTAHFKACVTLLLEIAQSGFSTTLYSARYEADLAVDAALKKDSCNADANDLIIFLTASRDDYDTAKVKMRRKAFERLMLRKTSRQMKAVLRQGYFTANTKKKLRETVGSYRETKNVYLRDATNTLMKILYDDEFFDLRNKEAFKIIMTVFDSIAVFDSISG